MDEKTQTERERALERLEAFVGEWLVTAGLSDAPPARLNGPRATFEWMLGEEFLLQRVEISKEPHPDKAPNATSIIAFDPKTSAYRQHYFDSRGVVRLYEMTFENRVWKLSRTTPDFTPLDFSQRFVGELSVDGKVIKGTWERSTDGSHWERDFDLTYSKLSR